MPIEDTPCHPGSFNFSSDKERGAEIVFGNTSVHSVINEDYLMNDYILSRGARWLSGRVSDSGARGRGFETYRHRVVSLSKTLYSPKVLVNYPGSGCSVPT